MVEVYPSIAIMKIDFKNTEFHTEKTDCTIRFFKNLTIYYV